MYIYFVMKIHRNGKNRFARFSTQMPTYLHCAWSWIKWRSCDPVPYVYTPRDGEIGSGWISAKQNDTPPKLRKGSLRRGQDLTGRYSAVEITMSANFFSKWPLNPHVTIWKVPSFQTPQGVKQINNFDLKTPPGCLKSDFYDYKMTVAGKLFSKIAVGGGGYLKSTSNVLKKENKGFLKSKSIDSIVSQGFLLVS